MSVALEQEEEVALTASSLWMLPLLLLQLILQLFGRHLSKLKQMRRAQPLPQDWQSFYPKLREAEWPIHVLLTEGAQQLLSGQKLDLQAIVFDPDPPDTFQPPMPRSALSMHQRLEDLARFNADPERYVRRHAARIARSESESGEFPSGANPNPMNPDPSNFPSGPDLPNPDPANFPFSPNSGSGRISRAGSAIRGPPDCPLPTADCRLPTTHRLARRARDRPVMPKDQWQAQAPYSLFPTPYSPRAKRAPTRRMDFRARFWSIAPSFLTPRDLP